MRKENRAAPINEDGNRHRRDHHLDVRGQQPHSPHSFRCRRDGTPHRSRRDTRPQNIAKQVRRRPEDSYRKTNPGVGEGMKL